MVIEPLFFGTEFQCATNELHLPFSLRASLFFYLMEHSFNPSVKDKKHQGRKTANWYVSNKNACHKIILILVTRLSSLHARMKK